MVFVVYELESEKSVYDFVDKTRDRYNEQGITVNTFLSKLRVKTRKLEGNKLWLMLSLDIGIPPVWVIGFFPLFIGFFVTGNLTSGWLIPSLIFFVFGFFFSPLWFAIMLKIALKKEGYSKDFKRVKLEKVLRGVIFGSKRSA